MTATVMLKSGLRILSQLSTDGHFSNVFLGHDELHGDVAVKICKVWPGETPDAFAARQIALLAEGQRLKQALHKNVVQVYDVTNIVPVMPVNVPGGILQALGSKIIDVLLVTEVCKGGNGLSRSKLHPMNIAAARNAAYEVALGLQCVHSVGLLHRDIKPGNILFDSKGCAKLCDFGLVTDQIINGFGGNGGYNPHMPPEFSDPSSQHFQKTSVCTDIWALGLTVYRLINGDHQWQIAGGSASAIVKPKGKHYSSTLAWLPHIPKEWRTFVKRCFNEDATKRLLTVSDVLSEIEKLPIDPDWHCVTDTTVTWTRTKGPRTHEVIWDRLRPNNHSWAAVNKPTNGKGNVLVLGGSNGSIAYPVAVKGLETFFQSQK